MRKKIVSLLLILVSLLAILGFFSFYFIFLPKSLRPSFPSQRTLTIFIWENYLSENIIKAFEEKYNIKVKIETFEDSDSMFSAFQSQPEKYDLVVLEDDYVALMKNLKFLLPLDHNKIPNLKNLKTEAKNNSYDPGNLYCVPYVTGYTGIAINTKYIPTYDGKRDILWDEKYKGKISMLNNSQEILFNALIYLGYTEPENLTPEKLDEAINLALKQKDLVIGFEDPISQRERLIKEEAWIAYIYSTEILPIKKENPSIQFFAPKEGAFLWADNFCISRDSSHPEEAHLFLNFLLDPKISAQNSQEVGILMVNEAMKEFLNPEFLEITKGLDFPQDREVLSKSKYFGSTYNPLIKKAVNQLEAKLGISEVKE